MIVKGNPDANVKLMPENKGIQIEYDEHLIEVRFEPEDINQLATKYVFVVEKVVKHESRDVIAVKRRKGEAKRFAFLQRWRTGVEPGHWQMSTHLEGDEVFKLVDGKDDISIVVRKMAIT